MIIFILVILLSQFGTSLLFHVQFCCFLTCIQVSREAHKVVWYSHLFKDLPQFVVIHTVKGFRIVSEKELENGKFVRPAQDCTLIQQTGCIDCLSFYQALFSLILPWGRSLLGNKGGVVIFSSVILYFLHPNGSVHLGLSGWLTKQVWSSSKVSQEPGNQFQCAEGLSRASFCPAVFI